jgi:hypothetical protein
MNSLATEPADSHSLKSAGRLLKVHVQTVLDLTRISNQATRRSKTRLQILPADDIVRRATGSVESMT